MSPRVGNVSFPVRKPTELTKKFYSDKLAKLMDEVCWSGRLSLPKRKSKIQPTGVHWKC